MKAWLLALLACALPALAEVSVTDFAGRRVTLPAPAGRIVALAPHVVENAFSAGAGEQVVGVVDYSDYPQAATAIPRVGSAYAWSLEAVVALKPDLVLMWGSGNGSSGLDSLQRLGIPAYVSEPRKLSDIGRTVRDIGHLAGTTEQATAAAGAFQQSLDTLAAQYRGAEVVSVFYEIWNTPLQTLNGEHMVSDVIRLCGGHNIFADAPVLAPRISLEAVLERDPMAIIASGMDAARPEWLDSWRDYPAMRAVQEDALFFIHPDLLQRPSLRILQGASRLCSQLDTLREG